MHIRTPLLIFLFAVLGVSLLAIAPVLNASTAPTVSAREVTSHPVLHISGAIWQVEGIASGGGYQIMALPLSPSGTGTQCCCTYLPCLLKKP
jgi:hypothetical protein